MWCIVFSWMYSVLIIKGFHWCYFIFYHRNCCSFHKNSGALDSFYMCGSVSLCGSLSFRNQEFQRRNVWSHRVIHVSETLWPHLVHKTRPTFYNWLNELAHLSFETRGVLGWRSWRRSRRRKEGVQWCGKKDHCSVSRGYMTSAQLLTKTQ